MSNSKTITNSLPWPAAPQPGADRQRLDASSGIGKPSFCCLVLGLGLLAMAGGVLVAHITRPLTGPYGPYVSLPANTELMTAESQKAGVRALFPDISGQQAPDTFASRVVSGTATHKVEKTNRQAFSDKVRAEWGDSEALESGQHTIVTYSPNLRSRGIINFAEGRVTIETIDGGMPVERLREAMATALLSPLDPIQVDMFSSASATQGKPPLMYGEELDEQGSPVRWAWLAEDYAEKLEQECSLTREIHVAGMNRLIHSISIPLSGQNYLMRAGKYRELVDLYAEKYELTAALVLAIMHTESNFNPFAISPSQAVGLMQIVPDTAGNEVYRYLMGTQGAPTLDTLLSPESNIKYGTTYLHLLARRYFSGVENIASRQMCIIAAYNGGPNAVLRLFDTDPDAAVSHINSLTPEEVYTSLTTQMPNLETRRYVEVVLGHMQTYSSN